jgi:transposase-like protein
MHLNLRLPKVEPHEIQTPTRCPFRDRKHRNKNCPGTHFKAHQLNCRKPLRDTQHAQVNARRYCCLKCQRTFRVYPTGVSRDHQSDTLKGLSVLLYILGLSYQGVADLLEALQYPLAKSTVYDAKRVQTAGRRAIQLRRAWLRQRAGQVKVLGLDFTHVKCQGQDTIVAVATAVLTGEPLTFDLLQSESALHTYRWIQELARAVGAEILVTDDADGLKHVADELGLQHQICRAHVNRNVHDLIGALGNKALEHPDPVPWELDSTQVCVDQFLEDLQTAEIVIAAMPSDGQAQLEQLLARYQLAPPPSQGHRATMWYRFRRMVLDWSENWSRLSLYRTWRGPQQEKLDGTNNVTEQIIGQRVKERYRTMRGYKRDESILNVSSLIGWLGMHGHENALRALIAS